MRRAARESRFRAGALAVGGVVAAAAFALPYGCTDNLVHDFGGYTYDSTMQCLFVSGVIDVVAGGDPGNCADVRCWISPCGSVYVTNTACDAPPGYADETDADAGPCVAALALYASPNNGQCENPPDGGMDAGLGCGF